MRESSGIVCVVSFFLLFLLLFCFRFLVAQGARDGRKGEEGRSGKRGGRKRRK